MSDVRVVALHKEERKAVRGLLLEAIKEGQDKDGMLLAVAEMLLKAKRAGDFRGLDDS